MYGIIEFQVYIQGFPKYAIMSLIDSYVILDDLLISEYQKPKKVCYKKEKPKKYLGNELTNTFWRPASYE